MSFTRITDEDMAQYPGVLGQATVPQMSVRAKQEAFEERAEKVLRPKHNLLIEELEANTAASDLGAKLPDGMTDVEAKVQAILNAIYKALMAEAAAAVKKVVLEGNKVTVTTGNGAETVYTIGTATQGTGGLMSPEDKEKLDGVEEGANKYALPTAAADALGGVKLSDAIDNTSGASEGVAATPAAVKAAYDKAAAALPATSAANFLRVVSFDSSTGVLTTEKGLT